MTAKTIPDMLISCRKQSEHLRRLARLAQLREGGEILLSSDALLHSAVIIESLCAASEKAVQDIARMDRSEMQLIVERDAAEETLSAIYEAVTGAAPEWSNVFTYMDAIDEVNELMAIREKTSHAH
ncbi:hypothetical protein [Shimwellia blattae]|uniref:Uncharacterized protein n=2 Tax=Shimwellia blattae TaxID=563 RepID=I2BC13_SHIBC|nr:hypothetical protein [Shimwellia blattae]AAX12938.1 hypothetical protein [Shimwellia blattae DSM 4481 = NBRC 105725]AFJ48067.1 hypothetical protein EBL_c29970 [Shimwellia blattae DSM 4481 = NBRC 105725]VDY65566.1 Uncharacterised protein [Shimwellia blattae]VEC24967.1 Uncharacterised protein [Shimwellia blattae]GAB81945.1 hypothetical protein EB105725_18_00730 [Shimwellia blattae DSM 4481 = NBRC 105725]